MTNHRFPIYFDAYGRIIDPLTIDLDRALQQGRHQRSIAFRSMLKSAYHGLFGKPADRRDPEPALAHGDCTAAA